MQCMTWLQQPVLALLFLANLHASSGAQTTPVSSPKPRSTPRAASASLEQDRKAVAALDTQYQAAVKVNDAVTMDHLLADDFVLVTGSGKKYSKSDLIAEAQSGHVQYDHQEDTEQTVRVWGDAAVVTAKLWEKGFDNGKSFDYTVWFSDTYVRTMNGWKYVFGQSSLPLPKPTT